MFSPLVVLPHMTAGLFLNMAICTFISKILVVLDCLVATQLTQARFTPVR